MLHFGELSEKIAACEVEQLISGKRIPSSAAPGTRSGNRSPCAMAMTHESLGRLVITMSYDDGRTKTEVTRRVPVHATFAKILTAWKLSY